MKKLALLASVGLVMVGSINTAERSGVGMGGADPDMAITIMVGTMAAPSLPASLGARSWVVS